MAGGVEMTDPKKGEDAMNIAPPAAAPFAPPASAPPPVPPALAPERSGAAAPAPTVSPTIIFVGTAVDAAARAALVEATGARILGTIGLDDLAARLVQQGRLDILWLGTDEPVSPDLADTIVREAARMDSVIICEVRGAALDAAFAAFAHLPGAQFLSAPDPIDRELAIPAALGVRGPHVADSAQDAAMERIERLQDEVARISAALASLAGRGDAYPLPGRGDAAGPVGPVGFVPQVRSAERAYRPESDYFAPPAAAPEISASAPVRRLLRQRRLREQFFAAELFADPAWDMLLDLYAARLEGHRVAVSSLCIAAAVPATTALRWIKTMTDAGLFERQADPRDGRRIFIALAAPAIDALDRYFAALAAIRD